MTFINDRIKRIRELGRDVNIKFELAKALELNALSLQNIRDMRDMSNTAGWQMLSTQMMRDIEIKKNRIYELSIEPDKNKTLIIINRAIAESLERILKLVDGTLNQEQNVVSEFNKLTDPNRG
jgi:hypothetical protein